MVRYPESYVPLPKFMREPDQSPVDVRPVAIQVDAANEQPVTAQPIVEPWQLSGARIQQHADGRRPRSGAKLRQIREKLVEVTGYELPRAAAQSGRRS